MTIQTKPLSITAAGLVFGFYLLVASVRGTEGLSPAELTDDALVLRLFMGAAAFAVVFVIGHYVLQRTRFAQFPAYVGLGTGSAVLVDIVHTPSHLWDQMIADGNLSTHLIVPALLGAVLGGIYRWNAVSEGDDEDPGGLSEAYRRQVGEGAEDGEAGLIIHGDAAYFDGPLRVRTSVGAFLLAAAAGCAANLIVTMIFTLSTYSNFRIADKETMLNYDLLMQTVGGVFAGSVYAFLTYLPVVFLVAVAHMVLRSMRQTSYAAYGLAGLMSSPVTILLTGGMAGSIGMFAVIPATMAALAYRRFAGLEPAPVAEDIVARNRRDLVGTNHVRRKMGRVVIPADQAGSRARFSRQSS